MPTLPIQLTKRDLQILELVSRHRLLTTDQILRAVQGSTVMLRKRISRLAAHQYLSEVAQPKSLYYSPGRRPRVWGLGKRAAQILETASMRHTNWHRRNKEASPMLVDHTLLAADIATRFELVHSPVVRVIDQADILAAAPQATQRARTPLGWSVTFNHKREKNIKTGVVPDRLLTLHFPLLPESRNTQHFLLEADTGTEPIERGSITQGTSITRKFLAYGASLAQRIPQERFNLTYSPRILLVTQVPGRVANMVAAFKRLNLPANAFLFATTDNLNPQSVLATDWLNGRGERVTLTKHFTTLQSFLDVLDIPDERSSSPSHERAVYTATVEDCIEDRDPPGLTLHAQAFIRGAILHLIHGTGKPPSEIDVVHEQISMRGFTVTHCMLENPQ